MSSQLDLFGPEFTVHEVELAVDRIDECPDDNLDIDFMTGDLPFERYHKKPGVEE